MELIDLYTAIVESAGWNVTSSGRITAFKGPVEIAGKQLVLPTNDVLRNPDWENTIGFHPMSENVMRGESAVLFELRQQMQFQLNFVAATIIQTLGEIAADETQHKGLTIKQKEFLKLVPDFDAKTVKSLDSLLDKCNPNEPEKIIGLFVKRGGEIESVADDGKVTKQQYKRLAVIHSPLRMEDQNKDRTVFGVKFRKVDYKPFFKLFDFILPEINQAAYTYGSNSMVAPSFHALLHGYISMAKRLNVVLRKFQKVWGEDFEDLLLDVSFEEDVKDLDKFKGIVPNLRGNEGSTKPDEVETLEEAPKQASASGARKPDWSGKQEQLLEEGRKMTLQEKLAANAPQPPANTSFTKPAANNAFANQPAPEGKKRFQDLVGGGMQQQQPARAPTSYGQPSNSFGQPQQSNQMNTSWGAPQNNGFNQQPQGRSATPYGQQNNNFNRSGW